MFSCKNKSECIHVHEEIVCLQYSTCLSLFLYYFYYIIFSSFQFHNVQMVFHLMNGNGKKPDHHDH